MTARSRSLDIQRPVTLPLGVALSARNLLWGITQVYGKELALVENGFAVAAVVAALDRYLPSSEAAVPTKEPS